MTFTLDEAVAAVRGRLVNGAGFPVALRIVTDTRTLVPGDTFLALRGERFDGHRFVGEAIAKGARGVIVADAGAVPAGTGAIVVEDTLRAYMDLARAARQSFFGRVVAITGSAGKTTTKHLLAQLLFARYGEAGVAASPANENNEIGVSRMLLSATAERKVLVVEMGARHAGEIAELVDVARPHVGVLTNIGDAHLEIFGSREALARTKWGLFSQGAQAVLNANDSASVFRSATLETPPFWFGTGESELPGAYVRDHRTLVLTHGSQPREYRIDVRLPGTYNRANLAAAIAAALLQGVGADLVVDAIPTLTLPKGRYEPIDIPGGTRIIYDAYNANTSGMIAAIDAFAGEPGKRRIAVLSSMAELGPDAPTMHERVGAHAAAAGIDMLLVGGDHASSMMAGALAAGLPAERVVPYRENADAAQWLLAHAGERDVVLLKGSRKYKMEEIVAKLTRSA
jgi:UDP-N-acetylmuramoyl-tripeptide--D-alanyl-D-alanine ligase